MKQEALARWLDAYARVWNDRTPDAVPALFTADAVYLEEQQLAELGTPGFGPTVVLQGHDEIEEFWLAQFEEPSDVSFQYEILTDDPPLVRWWTRRADETVELNGILLLDFGPDGRCFLLRWWHFGPP